MCLPTNKSIHYDNPRFSANRPVTKEPEERSLSLRDILPIKPKHYDKNRAPKRMGQPTIVYFHITVLSLDSINEESMASAPKQSNYSRGAGSSKIVVFEKFVRTRSNTRTEDGICYANIKSVDLGLPSSSNFCKT